MLNLLIALFFVYLILSMLCSGIQEAISGWIRLRGKMLLGAIKQMLSNQEKDKIDRGLFDSFTDNKWFESLNRSKLTMMQSMLPIKKAPSYLTSKTFSTILMQVLGGNADIKKVEQAVNSLNDGKLKSFLLGLLADAEGDVEKFKASISTWYDTTMHEVSLWYKHRSHTLLFIIGFILATITNADTFSIYNKLSADPETAAQIANLAETYVEGNNYRPIDTLTNDSTLVTQLDSLSNQLVTIVNKDLASVYSPLGLGWHQSDLQNFGNVYWWFLKILGLLITSFAIAMGASFWFNLLKSLLSWRKSSVEAKLPPNPDNPDR